VIMEKPLKSCLLLPVSSPIYYILRWAMAGGRRCSLQPSEGGVRQKHDTLQPASLLLQSAEFLKAKIRPQIRKTVSYRETIKLLRV